MNGIMLFNRVFWRGFLYFSAAWRQNGDSMETRVAMIGIIVEESESVSALNALLHDYGGYIIGRMGIPYREKGVNIISITLDAPQDIISALAGKIGRLRGVNSKAVYANV